MTKIHLLSYCIICLHKHNLLFVIESKLDRMSNNSTNVRIRINQLYCPRRIKWISNPVWQTFRSSVMFVWLQELHETGRGCCRADIPDYARYNMTYGHLEMLILFHFFWSVFLSFTLNAAFVKDLRGVNPEYRVNICWNNSHELWEEIKALTARSGHRSNNKSSCSLTPSPRHAHSEWLLSISLRGEWMKPVV